MHAWLAAPDGEKPATPFALFLSMLCEAFHCLPSAALREWLSAPDGLLESVIEARTFAQSYHQIQAGGTVPPGTPYADEILALDFDLVRQAREADGEDPRDPG